jgi:hypothetical protein
MLTGIKRVRIDYCCVAVPGVLECHPMVVRVHVHIIYYRLLSLDLHVQDVGCCVHMCCCTVPRYMYLGLGSPVQPATRYSLFSPRNNYYTTRVLAPALELLRVAHYLLSTLY